MTVYSFAPNGERTRYTVARKDFSPPDGYLSANLDSYRVFHDPMAYSKAERVHVLGKSFHGKGVILVKWDEVAEQFEEFEYNDEILI